MENFNDKECIFFCKDKSCRINLLSSMDSIVKFLNDEDYYYNGWIWIMPDGATPEDYDFIADDEELYNDCVSAFLNIFKRVTNVEQEQDYE